MENEIKEVLDSLYKRAREERESKEPYKNLFKASEKGLKSLLSQASKDCNGIIINLGSVIEKKFNIKLSNKLYKLLKLMPYALGDLRKEISEKESGPCEADKMREIYYQEVLEEIKLSREVKFFDPHTGIGGAMIPLPQTIKEIGVEIDGKTLILSNVLDKIKKAAEKLEPSFVSPEIEVSNNCILLTLYQKSSSCKHCFRLISFEEFISPHFHNSTIAKLIERQKPQPKEVLDALQAGVDAHSE